MHHSAGKESAQQGQFFYQNLPLQPTPLVGRGPEADALSLTLRRADLRLLTLIGPPGIGKTRLGLQVAANFLVDPPGSAEQAFPDGVCFVPLAPISDPDLVVSAITQALELRGASHEPLFDRLKRYLQSKQMLLFLDNFEQVVTAAPVLSDLLASCPGVKMLVTSRELLHLYGEHDYSVPPLSLPDPNKHLGLEALSHYEAVALFVQRAQAINPGFQLADHNAHTVAEICLRLDGLPLAIELAAARILVLRPEELLVRLKSRLKLLTGGARNVPERQRTLQAAIEWSYNLLDPGEQALFRRLGVFVGGCTLKAIEEVCGSADPGIDSLEGVTSLVGKSLLQRQDEWGMSAAGGEPRLMMLETIREYARKALEEVGEFDAISDRHCDYFLHFAENEDQGIGGNQDILWMRRLDDEQNNLRAALEWSLSRNGRGKKGMRLAGALMRYWFNRGYLSEGQQWCAQLLSHAEAAEPSVERARTLRTLARMVFEQGDYAEARPIFEKSLEMFRALGDDTGVAATLPGLGSLALWQGEYDLSLSLYEEVLAVGRSSGDKLVISNALSLIGTILMFMEEYEAAQLPLEEALAIDRELGNLGGIANTIAMQGGVAYHLGEYDRARALIEESLDIALELGVDWIVVKCFAILGVVALLQGDPQRAEALLLEGLARTRISGNKRWSRWYLVGLAEVARLGGTTTRAAKLIGASEGVLSAAGGHYEPAIRASIGRIIASVRAELEKESFARLRAEGQAMSLEETMAYALEPTYHLSTAEQAPIEGGITYPDNLTEREVDVLRLVAVGKSNQEIAQELVLSLRTVERHISNIYQKIGATGRVARATATAYTLRHGLTE